MLVFVEGALSDIADASKENQREDHLAEGQQDNSSETDEPELLDHRLTLVSHGFPLKPSHYQTDAVDHFLGVLGFGRQGDEGCRVSLQSARVKGQ